MAKKNWEFKNNRDSQVNAIVKALDTGNRKMVLNTHRNIVLSFTKNFSIGMKKGQKKKGPVTSQHAPIDSGQLRQSVRSSGFNLTAKTNKNGGIDIGSGGGGKLGEGEVTMNKGYGIYVEYGTSKMPARPVFRTGVADSENQNRDILLNELNKVNHGK